MSRFLAGVLGLFVLAGTALAYDTYSVTTSTLNVRSEPVNGQIVGQVSEGQRVTVYGVRGDWALITPQGQNERWVSFAYLTPVSASPPPQAQPQPQANIGQPSPAPVARTNLSVDSQIAKGAFPVAGQNGFTSRDVDILMRGARQMIQQGRCQRVEFAYKSTLNPGQYYVYCGNRSVFFTEADLAP